MFRRARAVVGLDIGSSAVKAVEVKGSGKSFKVTAFGIEPVPPDSIVDGAIIDGAAVADAIRRLFESKNIKTKDVAASLAGNAVIVKKITLPKMTEQELAESIYWEAEQYIPFDIQDVNLDYQVVGQGSGAAAGTMDVLLVAAKKEKIADYTGVITQAGRAARHRRRRRLRAAERLRGQLRPRPGAGRRARQLRRERRQHQHPERRPVALHARHLDRRQRLHRRAAARAEPPLRDAPTPSSAGCRSRATRSRSRGRFCARSPRTSCSKSRRRSTSSAAPPARIASIASSSAAAPRASTASSRCWPSASIRMSSSSIRSRR